MNSSTKRAAIAAGVAGLAFTAAPALANASSFCTYNTSNKNLIIQDRSGSAPLKIFRTASGEIRYSDGLSGTGFFCFVPGTPNTANVNNTERIAVFSDRANSTFDPSDGFWIDQGNGVLGPGVTKETDANSEIEVQIDTLSGGATNLTVIGTNDRDEVRVGARGAINLGTPSSSGIDNDVDVTMTGIPTFVNVFGRGGDDMLSGHGNEVTGNPAPYNGNNLKLSGSEGNDLLVGSNGSFDRLEGGNGNDRYFSVDGFTDHLFENPGGGDDMAEMDSFDQVFGGSLETRFFSSPVGKLTAAKAVTAQAGKPAHVKIGWALPEAWKDLRTLTLRYSQGGKSVAAIAVDPAHGRVTGHGAIRALRGSTVGHEGKTVVASLNLKVAKRLAGQTLRLSVEATDIHGRTQIEPLAGSLIVAR
jgi:hypothetical protein